MSRCCARPGCGFFCSSQAPMSHLPSAGTELSPGTAVSEGVRGQDAGCPRRLRLCRERKEKNKEEEAGEEGERGGGGEEVYARSKLGSLTSGPDETDMCRNPHRCLLREIGF